MSFINIQIGDCCIGANRAYIYILYSKSQHALYIGQTNDRYGVVGRLCSHIRTKGTFRIRLNEKLGIQLYEIEDLQVFCYRLPNDPRYTGIERSYREGIEYLLQKQLHTIRGQLKPYVQVVSNVDYNEAASLKSVQRIAEKILQSFVAAYS